MKLKDIGIYPPTKKGMQDCLNDLDAKDDLIDREVKLEKEADLFKQENLNAYYDEGMARQDSDEQFNNEAPISGI